MNTNNFWSFVPWRICCLGLEQKSSHSAHREFLCCCFLPRQGLNFHLLSSCKNHGLSLNWYRKIFSISMAACSLQRGEKRIGSSLKNQECPARGPQATQSTTANLFAWVQEEIHVFVLELSLQAGLRPVNVQENVGEKILLLMRTAPTFSFFRLWI